MSRKYIVLGGLLGAGLMYFLDPDRGHGRRNRVREKAYGAATHASKAVGRAVRHLGNRAQGLVAEAGSHLRCDAEISRRAAQDSPSPGAALERQSAITRSRASAV
jgi:hypothetical protein